MGFFDGALGPFQFFKSSNTTIGLLITCSAVFATTTGYDSALINGINILPSYTDTLKLTTATKSLNSAASFIGWAIVSTFMGPVVDRVGRRTGVIISIILKLIGVLFMTAAQNITMFVIGRIILGAGSGTSSIAASTWLAETLPSKFRAPGLSFIFSVYYVGALIAAGVTYRTADISGSWSWRLPCALQAVFSVLCGIVVFFVPESPHWLVHRNRMDDALTVLASTHSDGDKTHPEALSQQRQIVEAVEWERNCGKQMTYAEVVRTPSSRRRLLLVVSVAILAMSSGNNTVSYYLGDMLENAGITNSDTKLEINVVLSAWCLVTALIGTALMNVVGRKSMCLVSVGCMSIFLFLVGGLTKKYGQSDNNSGIYGVVASIFLFQGSYAVGITPLTVLYPPEVLNFSIRSNGMAAWSFSVTCGGVFSVFVWPFAMEPLGWKSYMINAAWDVVQFLFVAYFWVETKGLTLEEIDAKFDLLEQRDAKDVQNLRIETGVLQGIEVPSKPGVSADTKSEMMIEKTEST
ncbi:MFS sugar transporter-like protein [Ilyonectria destructans]|nr:MFS sugar transporter-like protein [Ilyonectria destructans]